MPAKRVFFLLLCLHQAHGQLRCPPHSRLCNDVCLDRTNKHKIPCVTGSSEKCLSAYFPFYCNLTDSCIGKDDICGDQCFDGNPGSLWFENEGTNIWKLTEIGDDDVYDNTMMIYKPLIGGWIERYNCNGRCVHYMQTCNGTCNHPDNMVKIKSNGTTVNMHKCGTRCRALPPMGFHDCGDDCLPQNLPCNGVCPDATEYATGPQYRCGDECRPIHSAQTWKECPDGTCRDNSVKCDGPLPGSCPSGQLLCRYNSLIRGTVFACWSSSDYYFCNETRQGNIFGQLLGAQNHPDNWCKASSEPCNGECRPGYLKCADGENDKTVCRLEKEYVKCEGKCVKSTIKHICNGACIPTEEKCDGKCAEGFDKCGDRCIINTETDSSDCNGECRPSTELCNGQCPRAGWVKVLETDRKDVTEKLICKVKSDMKKRDLDQMYECNEVLQKITHPCNGTCPPVGKYKRKLVGGQCLRNHEIWKCNGERIPIENHCNGVCYSDWKGPCGTTCILKTSLKKGIYLEHCGMCLDKSSPRAREPCDGQCSKGHVICGKECVSERELRQSRPCGDKCIYKNKPCNGECPEDHPYKCIGRWKKEEKCLPLKNLGDNYNDCEDGSDEKECFQMRNCNGKLLCINKPCHHEDPGNENSHTVCPATVSKKVTFGAIKSYAMYHCEAEDLCKLEGVPCAGVCVANLSVPYSWEPIKPDNQFACLDGTMCIDKFKLCNTKNDCSDGSDETEDACKLSRASKCEKVRCKDGSKVCADIPCNNTELINDHSDDDDEYDSWGNSKQNRWADLDELSCEGRNRELCTGGEGGPRCVKKPRDFDGGKGETCHGKCLSGVLCGNECLPNYKGSAPSCNGSCNHIESVETLTKCSEYCLTDEAISRRWVITIEGKYTPIKSLKCDGECRLPTNKEEYDEARRKPCNGSCTFGSPNHAPWILCGSRDKCFPPEEWCNGVKDCPDGTDEARCELCPKIKACGLCNPSVNQTASNGPMFPSFPKFPRYLCEDEPCCGECSIPDTYPCGNKCILKSQICSLTGKCSSSVNFKCDKCIDIGAVCDGKKDCIDQSDEENCEDYSGSWICNGKRQPKSKPC